MPVTAGASGDGPQGGRSTLNFSASVGATILEGDFSVSTRYFTVRARSLADIGAAATIDSLGSFEIQS